ncbi:MULTISPECIES: DUF3038 domain-containing protein [unclassified Thermosynechococcus]|uniref:DUF3038 domain-containing protein n=1 Tax=unclassified Thermosynechococcus TaxID=2622553 RepID=UPI001A0E2103|nr:MULTISPECIES: DUF3038 domain-containing protein [unclassified Thermosynechococcus]HIK34703.1 DUF3038 domain-containing protein [Thermosynechococcus sp. M98_K2018_005]HIK47521.1 DUF3038 domain-containing protein [Thermosynechococcus sp. M55_K2018_012]
MASSLPIKAQIDLILLSLEALAQVGSAEILTLAEAMGFEAYLPDRVGLWRLRQSSPLRRGRHGRRKLDVDEARALALICSRLAQQHQQTIRTAIERWQQQTSQGRPPHLEPILGDYIDRFTSLYQERMADNSSDGSKLAQLALDLLVDLFFYSTPQGARRLWITLLERTTPAPPSLSLVEPEPVPASALELPTLFPPSDV